MSHKDNRIQAEWMSSDEANRVDTVINILKSGKKLSKLEFINKIDERWDLRGLGLSSPNLFPELNTTIKETQISFIKTNAKFKNIHLENVDLSRSDLSYSNWEKCTFHNVKFDRAKLQSSTWWACTFHHCSFEDANMRDIALGGHFGKSTTEFHNISFKGADLRSSTHNFELYIQSDFSRAKLDNVSFEGARFEHCRFSGLLESVYFGRHSRVSSRGDLPWQRVDRNSIINEMKYIDFSNAILMGVDFDAVDLSTCIFPNDSDHIIVRNANIVFAKALKIVQQEWDGKERDWAKTILDLGFLRDSKKQQKIDVFNKKLYEEEMSKSFADRFTLLIRGLSM